MLGKDGPRTENHLDKAGIDSRFVKDAPDECGTLSLYYHGILSKPAHNVSARAGARWTSRCRTARLFQASLPRARRAAFAPWRLRRTLSEACIYA